MAADAPSLAFLLGVPRSGTTLFAKLLAAHPEVIAPPEPWLLLALESFGRTPARHPADSQLLSIAIDELFGRIQGTRALRALADDVYAQYLDQARASCFVDKTPRYWLILEFLEALYPDAPTLVLLRNPYAIAASLKSTWGIRLSADADRGSQAPYIADLVLGLHALLEHTERHPSLTIRYEQLVQTPVAEQARALAHLSRSADDLNGPGSLGHNRSDQTSFGDTKIRDRRLIDPSSLDTWQQQLDQDELQLVTELLGPDLLNRLGYGRELDAALRLGARVPKSHRTDHWRRLWREWLTGNYTMVRHAASWPVITDGGRIEELEKQAAVFHDSAENTERLLKECNEDRQQLRVGLQHTERQLHESNSVRKQLVEWAQKAERSLEESDRDRQRLLAWAQDTERRLRESNSDRNRLLEWAEEGERLLKECNEDRRQLRAWAEDAERRASK